ncbi:hypothetical protein NM688_g5865 [Phlebia brevispora]|uniref:Uncharacterized protein n=1 Tax=Phlebia brevispora TaxID=194682 RepID=A0ACC1SNN8_9APHY|nr:hypothetical protein NM688_g5865 [Phlebia brevispora]
MNDSQNGSAVGHQDACGRLESCHLSNFKGVRAQSPRFGLCGTTSHRAQAQRGEYLKDQILRQLSSYPSCPVANQRCAACDPSFISPSSINLCVQSSLKMNTQLYRHPAFLARAEFLSGSKRIALAYARARAVLTTWHLSVDDIASRSQRFWDMQTDPVLPLDAGCLIILGCHLNLFAGTLCSFLPRRPDLRPILESAVKGEFFGHMLLTEVGHGLDIMNLETTATKVEDGYILNTPHSSAAKFMPPTTPICPKMALVFARLIVDGEERGIHPFLVPTSDTRGMCAGITSRQLPPRSGGSPLDYAITTFDHIHLPPSSFLGASLDRPIDRQNLLNQYVSQVGVAALTLSVSTIAGAKIIACVGADYSYRRQVQGKGPERVPIISFRTQQLPVLYATAIAYVLDAWQPYVIAQYMQLGLDHRVRHGLTVVFKALVCRLFTKSAQDIGERLGAQGTFGHNLVSQIEMDSRGASIAEGDIVVLCIRLFSELLQGRYALPPALHPETLLSRHSAHLFSTFSKMVASFPKGHRDEQFNNLLLPQAEPAVMSLGSAAAYSSALDAGVSQPLLDLFECAMIKMDLVWYSEYAGVSAADFRIREDNTVRAALPKLKGYIDGFGIRPWVTAPIVSDEAWNGWMLAFTAHRSSELANVSPALARL